MVKVVPPAITTFELKSGKLRSPLTVTPESVPSMPVAFRVLPSAKASVPPLIVPPAMLHEPVALFSVSVLAGVGDRAGDVHRAARVAPGADAAGGVERAARGSPSPRSR